MGLSLRKPPGLDISARSSLGTIRGSQSAEGRMFFSAGELLREEREGRRGSQAIA